MGAVKKLNTVELSGPTAHFYKISASKVKTAGSLSKGCIQNANVLKHKCGNTLSKHVSEHAFWKHHVSTSPKDNTW